MDQKIKFDFMKHQKSSLGVSERENRENSVFQINFTSQSQTDTSVLLLQY